MTGTFSNDFKTRILDHIFGGQSLAVSTSYLGYFITAPTAQVPGSEPTGGGYQRIQVTPSDFTTSTTQVVQNDQDIIFPRSTGNHGNVVALGLFDSAVGGNYIAYYPTSDITLIEERDRLVVLTGGLVHQFLPGAYSNYLKDSILNFVYKAIPLPLFPTLYAATFTSAPSDAAPGTEPAVGGYQRVPVGNSNANFANTTGLVKTTATSIEFPLSSADQGMQSHFGWFTADTGGQFLAYGALDTPKQIAINDQMVFAAGDIEHTLV